jgi:hypothetical protein
VTTQRSPFSPAAKRAITTRLPDSLKAFDIEDLQAFQIDIQELELKEKIAEGAYGIVWRAGFHGRDVAIKVCMRFGQEVGGGYCRQSRCSTSRYGCRPPYDLHTSWSCIQHQCLLPSCVLVVHPNPRCRAFHRMSTNKSTFSGEP